uniref:Peptidase S1 domain-containing protein n=1 Tax=Anopheles culicifacies TaxID=139723 RepID=A0A182M165_9DIPT
MCMAILLLIFGFVGAENLLFSVFRRPASATTGVVNCGVRTSRRQPRSNLTKIPMSTNFSHSNLTPFVRNPKIMHGTPTVEGQYPWQVSLELLHPSYGFIGHWCGGVLIDRNWVLSAAHCIHNDLFNLPLPALWTVVLGEYDRRSESGFEQRIPVDKIILHEKYHNFKHDLVLLKLGKPANTSPNSRVRKICLPFADFKVNSMAFDPRPGQQSKLSTANKPDYFFDKAQSESLEVPAAAQADALYETVSDDLPEPVSFRDENFLRHFKKSLQTASGRPLRPRTARYMMNHLVAERLLSLRSNRTHPNLSSEQPESRISDEDSEGRLNLASQSSRRVFTVVNGPAANSASDVETDHGPSTSAMPDTSQYVDCLATGWGKSTIDDELTDVLLQTRAPIQNSKKCEEAYGDFIKLHRGHLCAGNLDGAGGTCVGDSGGPLQCRISKRGPWILVGITSFGSGCAFKNYPDVYTKISFYRQWIVETIQSN